MRRRKLKNSIKISIISIIIGIGIVIPIGYILVNPNNQPYELLLITLKQNSGTYENIPDFPLTVNGSAVDILKLNYSDFVTWSNLTRYVNITRKEGSVLVSDIVNYTGIPFRRLIYDIMNVSSYSSVNIIASDGYSMTFQQTDIDNPVFWDDLFLAYKREGQNLTDYYKPVYNVVTQNYTITKYGNLGQFNGIWCVRHVIAFQINS